MPSSKHRPPPDPAGRHAKTVLVVDDDASIRDLLTYALEADGMHTVVAENGMQALAQVRERRPDAVVLDITMPIMHGDDFLHAWRASVRTPGVPVIAMSAAFPAVKPTDLGVDAFFAKPFDVAALVRRVRELLADPLPSTDATDPDARDAEVRACFAELANQMSAIYGCVELIADDPTVTLLVRKVAGTALDASQRSAVLIRRIRHLVDAEPGAAVEG
jgi:CheY-like chemotaxis protein